jgi:hypothetical protein
LSLNPPQPPATADVRVRRLHFVVTCAAFLMFAWLATRHVGEGTFLEDQVDQLQNFESLLRLRPEGLWGGIMSGTAPPARALGPLGAVVFGVPVWLGLGIDAVHMLTSLFIVLATAVCFGALARIDAVFAWLWLLVFAATSVVWWNAAMLWSNTLLLPLGLIVAALTASCLRQPDRATMGWLMVTACVALQLHLVAIVAAPIVAVVWIVTRREARLVRGRVHAWAIGAAAVVAVTPYLLGEIFTGFANTRAILNHLGSPGASSGSTDAASATMSLAIALDPTRLLDALGLGGLPAIIVGATLSVVALRSLRSGPLSWLSVCAVAGIAGQALFFVWMSRPFAGYHHVTVLAPFYAVVPAVLVRRYLFRPIVSANVACALGGVVLVLLVLAGPSLADRFAERTPWSYARIRASLDALCGDAAADTHEGDAFAARLNPRYDSVLRYMMRRGMTTCRYQPSSEVVIAAARDGQYPASKTIGQATFYRELVLPPGIARYRRLSSPR